MPTPDRDQVGGRHRRLQGTSEEAGHGRVKQGRKVRHLTNKKVLNKHSKETALWATLQMNINEQGKKFSNV